MKAKFANLVQREGFLCGLHDGVLTCLDLKNGSLRWRQGRYGHGQGLLINDIYLLMAENGELVLLQPTPQSPNELHRFRVFSVPSQGGQSSAFGEPPDTLTFPCGAIVGELVFRLSWREVVRGGGQMSIGGLLYIRFFRFGSSCLRVTPVLHGSNPFER